MFWKEKTLSEMTNNEWESLCDGCGRCCVWKFQDEDTDEMLYTDIRCRMFNNSTCRCTDYPNRTTLITDCIDIHKLSGSQFNWLPETCAYRLLHEGNTLPDWHPLISGNASTVHEAGISLRHKTVSSEGVTEEDIIRHIIDPDEHDV